MKDCWVKSTSILQYVEVNFQFNSSETNQNDRVLGQIYLNEQKLYKQKQSQQKTLNNCGKKNMDSRSKSNNT